MLQNGGKKILFVLVKVKKVKRFKSNLQRLHSFGIYSNVENIIFWYKPIIKNKQNDVKKIKIIKISRVRLKRHFHIRASRKE